MDTNSSHSAPENRKRLPRGIIAGAILIMIGLTALLSQFADLSGAVFPLGLGLIFLAWGLLTRSSGLLVPGGILTGIFAGALLVGGPFANLSDPARGGVFLATFAGGWALISLLSLYTEGVRKWWSWPLYPGVVLGLIAAALLAGEIGLQALTILGYIWPVFLIAGGLYLVIRRWPRN